MKLRPLLLFPLLTGLLTAQDEPDSPQIRFIALGEVPGIFAPDPLPLPGHLRQDLPPRPLWLLSGEKKQRLHLKLCQISEPLALDADAEKLVFEEIEQEFSEEWLAQKAPDATDSLGVLYREHHDMNWQNPRLLLLDDGPITFPAGTVRFVNVSDRLVLVQIGETDAQSAPKIFGIPTGKAVQKPLKPGKNQIRVGYLTAGKRKQWIWQNEVSLDESERGQAFFYKADGEDARPSVIFRYHLEAASRDE